MQAKNDSGYRFWLACVYFQKQLKTKIVIKNYSEVLTQRTLYLKRKVIF